MVNKTNNFKHLLKKYGAKAQRILFSENKFSLNLPDLVEIQTKTYKQFQNEGIEQIFQEIFPIVDPSKKRASLDINSWFLKEPLKTIKQARDESKFYESPLYAILSLKVEEKEITILKTVKLKKTLLIKTWIEIKFENKIKIKLIKEKENYLYFQIYFKNKASDGFVEIDIVSENSDSYIINYNILKKEQVFFGNLPMMTPTGTFIINGSEKIIVSQLVRSPGAYFDKQYNINLDVSNYYGTLIPNRGSWIEIELEYKVYKQKKSNYIINIKIDKCRKITLTYFLTALGFKKKFILELFDQDPVLINSYKEDNLDPKKTGKQHWKKATKKIYNRIRGREIITHEQAFIFLYEIFNNNYKYNLGRPGRFKLNDKLDISKRILNHVLAEPILNAAGKVVIEKGVLMTIDKIKILKDLLKANDFKYQKLKFLDDVFKYKEFNENDLKIIKIKIFADKILQTKVINVIGINPNEKSMRLTLSDFFANLNYVLNLQKDIGFIDNIDHLSNRRIKSCGESLYNQFRIGMFRIERNIKEKFSAAATNNLFKMRPTNIFNNKPLTSIISEFFNISQLSQFMDQTNPLSELTNKRRITALGPSGLSRERAGIDVRDVHYSHYGRLCPIETPEGPNIGLISNLATYAKINKYGFITTPYRVVQDGKILAKIEYLTAGEELNYIIAQANIKIDEKNNLVDEEIIARFQGKTTYFSKKEINYVDVSFKQIVSIAASCIPFLENDDANRALMGSNMQRQAIPLIKPSSPIVGTGVEHAAARDSGLALLSEIDGTVSYVDAKKIIVKNKKEEKSYSLLNFEPSNQGTSISQIPIVNKNDKVFKNQILADGPAMENGELALGQNVIVAFTTWYGYNFEDAIVMSERLYKNDYFTSIHIKKITFERRMTKLGPEEFSYEIPNVSDYLCRHLGKNGVVTIGSEVKSGDILVGKITPKGQSKLSSEDELLQAIFGEKTKGVEDNSLRLPNGEDGIVQNVKYFSKKAGHELDSEVLEKVKIYIVQKRKIQEGDKMSGRHGNKGVVSKILPIEDMPYLSDGTPVDILLNPLGVPSRMNIGQILELHLGWAAKNMNYKVAVPVFEGRKNKQIEEFLKDKKAKSFKNFKTELFDGTNGEKMSNPISVGVMYMIKLSHMVEDKIHARSVGPYSLISQQPLGGKSQKGGQRFGEMEVWALESYGAAYNLKEMLTIKSDDIIGRNKTYEAIVRNLQIHDSGIPESFNVLTKEIQALGFNITLTNNLGESQNISEYNKLNYEKWDYKNFLKLKELKEQQKKFNQDFDNENEDDDDLLNQ